MSSADFKQIQAAKGRALTPEFSRRTRYLGDESRHPIEAEIAAIEMKAYIRDVVMAYARCLSDLESPPESLVEKALREAYSALNPKIEEQMPAFMKYGLLDLSAAYSGFWAVARTIKQDLIRDCSNTGANQSSMTSEMEAAREPSSCTPGPTAIVVEDPKGWRVQIDRFIASRLREGYRVTRKDMCKLAGYRGGDDTELGKLQRGDESNRAAVKNFRRVLGLSTAQVRDALEKIKKNSPTSP